MKKILLVLICSCIIVNVFAEQDLFSQKQYFIDSAQMLTECLYVVQKTGRFDIVEKQILSNAKIGKIPHELRNIAKRIIDTCQQGRIALRSEESINREFGIEITGIGIIAGNRLGSALAMQDPVGAIWAVYAGVAAFSNATAKNNQRINAVLQQLDYRIKSDMYDLRNCITENAERYNVDASKIISFENIEELEKLLPRFSKNPDAILDFMHKYPYYSKLKYYAIKYRARDWGKIFDSLISTRNSILHVDQDRLNACANSGHYIIARFIENGTQMNQEDRLLSLEFLKLITQYGLQNGGHSCSVFYFMRGVANSFAQYYDLKRMSENNIWSDLLHEANLDNGEYMDYQSFWCATWLSWNADNSNAEQLEIYLKAALKEWKPSYVMNNSPFNRSEIAQYVYKNIFKIQYEWSIYYGIFNDDISLKNKSPFPLNNVTLSVTLRDRETDDIILEKDIKSPYIAENSTYTWTNVMSIKNGGHSTVSGKASIQCDESSIEDIVPSFVGDKQSEDISPKTMCNIGIRYTKGHGVKQDFKEAVKWYEKAVKKGDACAQCSLAFMYLHGFGVSKDNLRAFSLYSASANQKFAPAQFHLACMYEEGIACQVDSVKALELYRAAAEQGHLAAQLILGKIYLYGYCNVQKNYSEAFQWFTKTANAHIPEAQFFLGLMYEGGQGVEKNLQEAMEWYRKAASAGFQDAKDKIEELNKE